MYWRNTIKEDGTLQHLFWSDGVSRMDYSLFGDVLAFDATYRKIRYNTPLVIFSGVNHHNQSVIFGSAIVGDETEETYVWLLKNFVEAMEGKLPVSVITDGDLAMRNAIRRVFPNAHHRL
jgi:transposase-like protein